MSNSMRPHGRQPTRLLHPWDSPGKNTGVGCHFLLHCMKMKVKLLSRVQLCATPWTAAHQAPPSMGFSRQEYWSGVPLPSPQVNNKYMKSYSASFVISQSVSSVAQLCPTLCDPMNRSTPGLPVHHQLLESSQTHVHQVSDAIQPSHALLSPSPPALNLYQHQGLFK